MNKYPTIVAIATPLMKCAIHVIRISGSDCYEIVNKVTSKKIKKDGYTIQHVNIYDHDKVVDDVLVLKYVAPKSYTGEDMVEITCHGSPFIASKIVELLVINGAKAAGPGEFTKRAFLNNKLNLLQAEGINNLINSNSNASLKIAHKSIDKKTSEKISRIVSNLFLIIGQVEVNIDYPEYDDVPQISNNEIKARLTKIIKSLNNIVDDSNKVIPYINGIKIRYYSEISNSKLTVPVIGVLFIKVLPSEAVHLLGFVRRKKIIAPSFRIEVPSTYGVKSDLSPKTYLPSVVLRFASVADVTDTFCPSTSFFPTGIPSQIMVWYSVIKPETYTFSMVYVPSL